MSWRKFLAALLFYTNLPLPATIAADPAKLDFLGIAAYAPIIGIGLGAILSLLDDGLVWVIAWRDLGESMLLLRSAVLILALLWLTGGLHLDGAMDTADGLAVTDPQRRLEVMADSHTGAFGVMAAIAILMLKTIALAQINQLRGWVLIVVLAWARWGQLRSIAAYAYLKPAGKGKFHKDSIKPWQPWLLFALLGVFFAIAAVLTQQFWLILPINLISVAIAWLVGAWFNHQLGGHTGDTYGAVVEWSEALILVLVAIWIN
ncbi:cobalamin-5'-phosphate synthase [Thalassoporum mexicanum PCC 7367]|uniref:adenosylcobinamide-GDP ribazoletransferase n=1 Tax=Thalassoporum mexicanum TaxID=3457544 RepID=UPI00029FBCE9|nr:adenosylcobinamide-GDP ribazoletransferase [Pseudanabaena sp. PCC 7367]AFY70222.1 cobalamin-5'-phosphate synthase [Pseudanabaena sp. PCC 7367]